MTRRLAALAALMVVATACSGSSGSSTTTSPPASAAAGTSASSAAVLVHERVEALDNTFRPAELMVEAGTEVLFENVGRNEHDVTPNPQSSFKDWGVAKTAFGPKAQYRYVFRTPGRYEYVCTIHGVKNKGMVGVVVVTTPGG